MPTRTVYDVVTKIEAVHELTTIPGTSELMESQAIDSTDRAVIRDLPGDFEGEVSPRLLQKLIEDIRGLLSR